MKSSVLNEFVTFFLKETLLLNKTQKQYQNEHCGLLYLVRFKKTSQLHPLGSQHFVISVGISLQVHEFCFFSVVAFFVFHIFPVFCAFILMLLLPCCLTPPSAFTGAIFCGYTQNKANCYTRRSINFQLHTNVSQIVTLSRLQS